MKVVGLTEQTLISCLSNSTPISMIHVFLDIWGTYCSHFITMLDLYPVWLGTVTQDRKGCIHLSIHNRHFLVQGTVSEHDETRAIINKSPSKDFFTNFNTQHIDRER